MSHTVFLGARLQDRFVIAKNKFLRKRGWVSAIIPFIGYGTDEQLRVLGRAVLIPAKGADKFRKRAEKFRRQRGWRNFFNNAVPFTTVRVSTGGKTIEVETDRMGYIDIRLKNPGLTPGWHEATLETDTAKPTTAKLLVVSSSETCGLISDIDDTVISTYLPRPLVAAWNSFVATEEARHTVAGMPRMYQNFVKKHPGAPIIYVSTGTWNTVPFLSRFLNHYGFPVGPFLLTDWGPTNTGWFRSGIDHKRRCLRELARDFPNIKWILIGDDGQNDPYLYNEFAELQPDHVAAVGIRQLAAGEQVLAHGTTTAKIRDRALVWDPDIAPVVKGQDGFELEEALRNVLPGSD